MQGFASRQDEIHDVLARRGQGNSKSGSRKGRPTNFSAPFKGNLSDSTRAIAQRERAAQKDAEALALSKAKDGDRAAKHQLKKRLKKDSAYISAPMAKKEAIRAKVEEELDENRFRSWSSGKLSHYIITVFYLQAIAEWLEKELKRVHRKWDDIDLEMDMRKHQQVLGKRKRSSVDEKKTVSEPGPVKYLAGFGGALEQIMRMEYQRGHMLLKTNSFKNPAEKDQWVQWCNELSPEELSIVTRDDWQ